MNRFYAIVFSGFVLSSCTSDSESDLYDGTLQENITYTNDIKPIITENCIMCHSQPPQNGAPMPLTTYTFVKDAVEHRGLLDRVSSTDPNFWMPFMGERLPQSKIDMLIAWENAGMPE
ncbi:hypothetical protein [Flavobacterium suncheonense]|uniref:Cytochrome c domain-containing protein n=1 Tax=Flavobacterium suncheonense GH29-5 = DSM 17707 TaxID=1121899 RepID=A0A0A2MMH3_9FLAO|nr:hypothetical protein [Flavobacterium suncheonense]KGO89490.1 hypothetical protein Q764_06865 [Flavobacterium suncheonense GH29-5 = DSM 17707]